MWKILKYLSLLAAGITVFWNQPIYRHYKIDGKGQLKNIKIVFLSDLHNSEYGKDQRRLLKMIEKTSPDLIFFGGDIADEKSDKGPVVRLLMALEDQYPMFYITGNHEYWMENPAGVHQLFRDYGVEVLIDATTHIQTSKGLISLVGLDDPDHEMGHSDRTSIRHSIESTYESSVMKGYKILLSHRPEHINTYMKYGFDLILSGHAHGGQVRIPWLLNGLYCPNQGFLPKYAGGLYSFEETDFIVSRGLSFRKKLPRVMNPPEVVVITID